MTKYRTIDGIIVLVALVTGIGIQDSAAASDAYTVTDLGSGGRGYRTNASGQVTGLANITGDGFQHAFLWTPTAPNGVSGTMQNLGTLGGSASNGYRINSNVQVTGLSDTTGDAAFRAFLWTPMTPGGASGTMNDLGTLGGTGSNGYAINAGGQVVGQSGTSSGFIRAFLWTPSTPNGASGSMINLGTLGGNYYSIGQDINDQGQVVGSANTTGDTATHAFLY